MKDMNLFLATCEPEVCETDLVMKIVCKCGLNISIGLKQCSEMIYQSHMP